jgi:hypothetical protein
LAAFISFITDFSSSEQAANPWARLPQLSCVRSTAATQLRTIDRVGTHVINHGEIAIAQAPAACFDIIGDSGDFRVHDMALFE